MRLANEIAAAAMDHVRGVIRPGTTEAQVAAEWLGFVHGEGTGWAGAVDLALGFSLVWAGAGIKTFTATLEPARRRGRADAVRDLGLRRRLLGRPHEERRRRRADRAATACSRPVCARSTTTRSPSASPERACAELDRRIRDGHRGASGIPGQPSHPICHGVGARAHEPPYPHQAAGGEVAEGMVFAIEPGCYWENGGGLRLEDNFLITADGPEKLSPFPDGIVQA